MGLSGANLLSEKISHLAGKEMQMRMKGAVMVTAVLLVTFAILSGPQAGQNAEELAVKASSQWLALVDGEKYAESWDGSSQTFKAAMTKEKWKEALTAVRKPLGKLISRSVKSKQYATSLPGAPDGEYVVVQYSTSFENKKSAVETVTPVLDKDGKWRVSGYYIR
jgi:hypothetical protein